MPLDKMDSKYLKWENRFFSDVCSRFLRRSCTCCRKVQSTKRKSHPGSILQLDPAKNNRVLKNKDKNLPPHKTERSF